MARSSRISSGSTSRVPEGIGWLMGSSCARGRRLTEGARPRLRVNRLRGHALDSRAEPPQALVDLLVAAIDLADVADLRHAVGAQRGDQHRHPSADVGRLQALATQAPGAG